jgi:hypothetical protein
MLTRRVLATMAAAGLGMATLAGCGGSGTAPAGGATRTVDNALQADINQPGLRMTVTFRGAPAAITAPGLSTAQKQALLHTQVVVTAHGAGSTPVSQVPANSGSNAFALTLANSGTDLLDVRYIGDQLYLRANLNQLTSDYQLAGAAVTRLKAELVQVSAVVTAARALADDQWVSLDVPAAEGLIANQVHVSAALLPHLNPGELIQIVVATFTGLEHNTTATSTANPYQLAVNKKGVATTVSQALASAPGVSLIPGIASVRSAAGGIPSSATARLTATVTGGRVTRLEAPAGQFAKGYNVTAVVAIATAGGVAVPPGATPVDLSQVSRLIAVVGKGLGL